MTDLVTVAVPGLPTAGPITGNELVAVHQNGRLVKVRQGDIVGGGAAFLDRVAAVAMTAGTVVVSAGAQMAPADPTNAEHCGRVLGILVANVAKGVLGRVQSLGLMAPIAVPVTAGSDALFVGLGGALVRETPSGAKWRQVIARSDTATAIVIALGEASLIEAAPAGEGIILRLLNALGVPTDANMLTALEGAVPNVPFLLRGQATTVGAVIASASQLNHKLVEDADYQCLPTDRQVGMKPLTAPRTILLPDVDLFPLGEVLFIADYSAAASEEIPITIRPGPGTDDVLGVEGGALQIISPRSGFGFRRGDQNLWIRA